MASSSWLARFSRRSRAEKYTGSATRPTSRPAPRYGWPLHQELVAMTVTRLVKARPMAM